MKDPDNNPIIEEADIRNCVFKDSQDQLEKALKERDEAREELQEWKDGAYTAEHPCPEEVHCTCVPLLLSKIAALRKERDEAREAICDFVNGQFWPAETWGSARHVRRLFEIAQEEAAK